MRWYARGGRLLARQLGSDAFVVAWALLWWLLGRFTDTTIRAIAEPARQTATITADLRRQVTDAASQAGGVPVVGDGLRQPFDAMANSLRDLGASAAASVAPIELTATVAGVLTTLVPIALVVLSWLPRRVRFALRAAELNDLAATPGGTELLALRALATQPLSEVRAITPDAVAAWRSGDPEVTRRLADLELASAGLVRRRAGGRSTPRS